MEMMTIEIFNHGLKSQFLKKKKTKIIKEEEEAA